MKNNIFHILYLILSKIPDVYYVHKYLKRIRALVLSFESTKNIGQNVSISSNVKIWKSTNLTIGDDSIIKNGVIIGGNVKIGKNSQILSNSYIDGSGGIIIGDYSQIGRDNYIYSHDHDIYNKNEKVIYSKETYYPVEIGNDVMLFSNVSIMAGIKIALGSVIAHGSIVTKDTDQYGIYAGIPAKKINERK